MLELLDARLAVLAEHYGDLSVPDELRMHAIQRLGLQLLNRMVLQHHSLDIEVPLL